MREKPNVLFILADDLGYGDFSFFNQGLSQTPTLETLFHQGICLTQHYSASPVCSPARAALLTGRYPHRTGSIDTFEMHGLDRLAPDEITLADILKNDGYTTGLVGKWHLGAIEKKYHPTSRGFDEFVGFRGGWQDYYRWHLFYNEKLGKSDGRYLTDVFTEEAISFIRRHKREPFFLHLCYNAPHFPLQAPEEDLKPFLQEEGLGKGVAYIYALVRRMDTGIGQILEELKKLGIENNTIVFFTSDNGPQFGEGEMSTTRFNCNFRGCKGNVFEGGIRVPMLIRWPGRLPGGKIVEAMVHFVDWLPTILEMIGIATPSGIKKLDGESLWSALQGSKNQAGKRFWQWNRLYPVRTSNIAMRDGDWKLVRPPILATMKFPPEMGLVDQEYTYHPGKITAIFDLKFPEFLLEENPPLLFNLKEDPLETTDLSFRYPQLVAQMDKETDDWFQSVEEERGKSLI
ncbi:MAG: sulfatase-like hydrolase/transferase [Candidatus Omnitrophica bacterium]|nr:sulfatase-like hydrolase/transferase [Candidatus Omnitrophota bacterium]